MRPLFILLLTTLLLGAASTQASYRPAPPAAHMLVAVSSTDVSHSRTTARSTRAERRLQKFLHRIYRALPDDGEGKIDTVSLVSMILGVVGLLSVLFFPYLLLLSIPALVLGIIGLGHVKRDGTKGFGFAVAGIVTGALGILAMLGVVIIAIVVLAWIF